MGHEWGNTCDAWHVVCAQYMAAITAMTTNVYRDFRAVCMGAQGKGT